MVTQFLRKTNRMTEIIQIFQEKVQGLLWQAYKKRKRL